MRPTRVEFHNHYPRGLEIVPLMVAPDISRSSQYWCQMIDPESNKEELEELAQRLLTHPHPDA